MLGVSLEINLILRYGADILRSDMFQAGFFQEHHKVSTVSNHSLNVAVEAMSYCIKHDLTDGLFLEKVITACLYHDLGILNRDKYKNTLECWNKHPDDSVEVYLENADIIDFDVVAAIQNHMKFKSLFSKDKMNRIISYADKKAAIKERLSKRYSNSTLYVDFVSRVA